MNDQDTGAVPVQAIQRTFQTLETLKEIEVAGVTELANLTGQPKSTVHNHLRTLSQIGYVVNDGGRYRLSLRFLDLGHCRRQTMEIYENGTKEIDKLAEETGDLANLMVEEQGMGVYLSRSMGSEAVNLDTYPGQRVPLHSTALGKVILARYPVEHVRAIVERQGLSPVTDKTITDEGELMEALEGIRNRGHAYDEGEHREEIRGVAAPITDVDEQVQGAVSVSAPTSRMKGDRFREELPDLVTNAATLIEINMTYP